MCLPRSRFDPESMFNDLVEIVHELRQVVCVKG